MKISVSLPAEDIDFLDGYALAHRHASRSAAVHAAVRLLRAAQLTREYEGAWDEWIAAGEAEAWDAVAADGVGS